MAITIHIRYKGADDNARSFAREMLETGIVDQIRAEAGNLKYEYFCPICEDGTILLIDSWRDQAALDAHHHSPMMDRIMALREKYDLHMQVERYVSDASGIPGQDQAYIRE